MLMDVCAELLACPLFKDLTKERLASLLSPESCRLVSYEEGERIITQGTRYDHLIVLLDGKAAARFYEFSGKTMLVENLEAPAPIAGAILFSSDAFLPVTLEAVTPVRTAIISRKGLTRIFQHESSVLHRYLQDMGDKVSFLAEKVRLAGLAGLRQKIADYLLRLRSRLHNETVTIPFSRERLAEMFSVARPSLSRELSKMAEEGIIRVDGRTIRILDTDSLESLLEL